jgi:hypothetical protein
VKKNCKFAVLTGITEYLTELQKKSKELDRDLNNVQSALRPNDSSASSLSSITANRGPDLFSIIGKRESSASSLASGTGTGSDGGEGSAAVTDDMDKERVFFFLKGGDFHYR